MSDTVTILALIKLLPNIRRMRYSVTILTSRDHPMPAHMAANTFNLAVP